MAQLFISYNRKDEARVEPIEACLNKAKINTWRDTVAMPYAVNWDDAVIEALCRSSFAVIFDSKARQEKMQDPTSPLVREFDWIQDIHIKYKIIDLEAAQNQDPQVAANEIIEWIADETMKNGSKIETVRLLVSGAYSYKNNLVFFEKGSVPNKIIDKIAKLVELHILKTEIDSDPEFGTGPLGLRESYYGYIKKYRNRILSGLYLKLLTILSIIVVAVIGIWSAVELFKSYITYNNMARTVQGKATISRVVDEDPVMGAALLNSPYVESYATLFYNYVRVLEAKYPTEYYSGDEAVEIAQDLSKHENAIYSLELHQTDGIIYVNDDSGFCSSFTIDGVPGDYDWSEDGKCVAVSTANKVFLYYEDSIYSPEELRGNYEDIDKVYVEGQKVYAITQKQNIVVWDISSNQTKELDYQVSQGVITTANGDLAAYISDQKLVINADGIVTEYELPIYASHLSIALSHDGRHVAVMCTDVQGSTIYDFDINTGTYEQVFFAENYLYCLDYSFDDSSIWFSDWSDTNLKKFDLSDGTLSESKSLGLCIYSLKAYENGCIVCLENGTLVPVNNKLVFESGVSDSPYGNLAQQIAVSNESGVYYTVTRNATNFGCAKYYISGQEQVVIMDPEEAETAANSAVAISDDGGYVAIGFDDGRITVRSVSNSLPVLINRDIKEGIVALSFSDDGKSLLALGKSGTLYKVQLASQVTDCNADDYKAQLEVLREQGFELFLRLRSLKLTDLNQQEFLLEKNYEIKEG